MGAVVGDQAYPPALVLEEHQILTQDAQVLGRRIVGEIGNRGHWAPVAAVQLAAWRSGPDPRDELVLFDGEHAASSVAVVRAARCADARAGAFRSILCQAARAVKRSGDYLLGERRGRGGLVQVE